MTDKSPTEVDLVEMINAEMEELQTLHPCAQPGRWDATVKNIRAIRRTLHAESVQKMRRSQRALMGDSDG